MSYRSHADLGGLDLTAPIVREPEDERFHAPWERQAFALSLAATATGAWNLDMVRSARETLPDYRALSYYAVWIKGLEQLLQQRGLVSAEELAAGRMLQAAQPVQRVLHAAGARAMLARGAPVAREASQPARFAVGDPVRTRADAVDHHTRLPGYARGKRGRIERVNGAHVFPDTHAQGLGEQPQWLYTVAFTGRELWGEQAAGGLEVSIDAWEPYLQPLS